MKTTAHIRITMAAAGLILSTCVTAQSVSAFDARDVFSVGAAYATHLFVHELGHQSLAMQVGATGTEMHFFTRKGGNFYAGLSTYDTIPEKSRLPYAVAGDRMAGLTFDYALQSYRGHSTTYNKALMFFSCADFLVYTLVANYVHPGDNMYDPNLIREETGCSKEILLSLVAGKTLLNAYRVMNPEVRLAPEIWVDSTSAALMVKIPF